MGFRRRRGRRRRFWRYREMEATELEDEGEKGAWEEHEEEGEAD